MADNEIELEGWTLEELKGESDPIDPVGSLAVEIDEEIDWGDEDEDSELFGEIESALLEDDEDEGFFLPSFGRVAMANRVRDARSGNLSKSEGYGAGYRQGVLDALTRVGMSDQQAQSAYSGLFSALGKGIFALGQHVVVPALTGAAGLEQGAGVKDLAYQAGSGARTSLSSEDMDDIEDAPIHGDSLQSPPVYVADDIGAHEGALSASSELGDDLDRFSGLKGTSKFSAAVAEQYGYIGRQPWREAKRAADRSTRLGSDALRASSIGESSALVHDPGAKPVVYGNGRIVDDVHGPLCTVPCPSCSRVEYGAMKRGAGKSCLVCDGNGAILVPDGDLPAYKGCVSYGAVLIPLLISAGASAAGSAFDSGAIFPKASGRFREWKAERKEDLGNWIAERRDSDDDSDAFGALDSACVVGAIVPASKLEAISDAAEERDIEAFAGILEIAEQLDEEDSEDYDDLEESDDLVGQE